jgi:hypothetical protein
MTKPPTAPASLVSALTTPLVTPKPKPKHPGGRPTGSKTRPDAPSKLAKLSKLVELARQAKAPATPTATPPPETSRPDSDLFGKPPSFERELPPDDSAPGLAGEPTAGETPPEETAPDAAESHRALSMVIWDSIVGMLSIMIGPFWQPRKVGGNASAGEIPYDERQMVIDAFCKYFAAVGMAILSPVQELWLSIGAYASPRLVLTLMWLKARFSKKGKGGENPNPANDPRFAETKKEPEKPTETPKPVEPAPIAGT